MPMEAILNHNKMPEGSVVEKALDIPKSHINEEKQIKIKETFTNEFLFFNKTEIPMTKIKMETRNVRFERIGMGYFKFK